MGFVILILGVLILIITIGAVPGFVTAFLVCMSIVIAICVLIFFINEKIIEKKENRR